MPLGYWDQFLATQYAPDNGEGDSGGGTGGGQGGSGGGQGASGDTPKWKAEFGDNFDPDRAYSTIEAQRKAEREALKRAEAAEKKLKEREDAERSDLEKAQARATELEEKLKSYEQRERESALRAQVAEVAKKIGAYYPEDVYVLVHEDLEVGDDGKVRNADAVVKSLKQNRPALFQRQTADAGSGRNGNAGPSEFNQSIRSMFGR